MLDNFLRGAKDLILTPIAKCLTPLHPTVVTVVAFLVGIACGFVLTQQWYIWGIVLWLLNRFFDGLDGVIARMCDKQTDLGGYLDIVADFAIYALIPIALVTGMPSSAGFLSLAFLLASFYINAASWMYLAAILEKRKHGALFRKELTTVTMPTGLIGGTETIILFSLFILFPQQHVGLFTIMGLLVFFTIGQRLVWAIRTL